MAQNRVIPTAATARLRAAARRLVLGLLSIALLVPGPAGAQTAPAPAAAPSTEQAVADTYLLASGDRVRVIVYNEPDVSGDFDISGNGDFSMPLIGTVSASGATKRVLETRIRDKLLDGYLKDPKVSVQILSYRPFYILGEVKLPGNYPYISGMHVVNAIAVAGGYTLRGSPRGIVIERSAGDHKDEIQATEDTPVLPGDILRVSGRLF